MNGQLRRKILIISIVLIVVVFAYLRFSSQNTGVDIVSVTRGPLQITIEEEGRTRLKDRFTISAPTAGYMRRSKCQSGRCREEGADRRCSGTVASHRRLIPAAARRLKLLFPPPKRLSKPR